MAARPTAPALLQEAVNLVATIGSVSGAALSANVPRNTMDCRVREARRQGYTPGKTIDDQHNPAFLQSRIKRLEGELKSTMKRVDTHDDTLHVIKKIIHDCDEPVIPPKWLSTRLKGSTTGVPCLFVSDVHYDEVVKANQINGVNAYNRKIANTRLETLFTKTVELLIHHMASPKYDYFVLDFGGDNFSGLIHEELRRTNECSVSQSILALMDQLVAGIDLLLQHFPHIKVNCVVGNHGRWDKKPVAKDRVYENFEWILYQFLAKYYRGNRGIHFNIADGADLLYQVYDTVTCLTHGDQAKGGSGIAGALSPLMIMDHRKRKRAMAIDQPFTFLKMGHWHQLWMAKGIIVNGSVKGMDEWAFQQNFDYELPQQWMYILHPEWGITARWPIILEKPGTKF